MALVPCRECGDKVSDSATTCPHCGVDGPAGIGRLVIVRAKQFFGSIGGMTVSIDSVTRDKLRPGAEAVYELSPGKHDVELGYQNQRGGGPVVIRSGRTITCTASISKVNGALKVEIQE